MEHSFTLLFYFISFLMHFHRFCDQNKTQLNSSQPIRVIGSHVVDFTHGNKIVHYFHCVGDASLSASKGNRRGWAGQFFLQEFVFAAKTVV